jgi:hypothetical protein
MEERVSGAMQIPDQTDRLTSRAKPRGRALSMKSATLLDVVLEQRAVWLDGALLISGSFTGDPNTTQNANGRFSAGATHSGTLELDGKLARHGVIASRISDAQVDGVMAYLTQTYGIA